MAWFAALTLLGSSPLTRGKPDRLQRREQGPGIIPAHAGKTIETLAHVHNHRDHPRSRGENVNMIVCVVCDRGSSPLTRGKRIDARVFAGELGIIPAHAGKTSATRPPTPVCRDHPRSRGENANDAPHAVPVEGSSPLTRGKPRRSAPASLPGWDHPRSRGENYAS